MEKRELIVKGKAKSMYTTDDPACCIMHFRDDTSAFDGERIEQLARKGRVNNMFNAFIMEKLAAAGIPTHFIRRIDDRDSLVRRMTMIPVECVVRNIAAGSICKRLGVKEGIDLEPPTFELFLKNDPLHDPMINESHIAAFKWARLEDVEVAKSLTLKVNGILKKLFSDHGMLLVDYKLEFGVCDGKVLLGDEFTPDGCRIWDAETREKLDKDRFRQSLGNVVESYEVVGRRLGLSFD
jgi:phosphoribosylaminoimidazole-succinocarboxamide synthase